MAVYTPVALEELNDFISQYDLGRLLDYAEIADGIENSNYFVTLKRDVPGAEDTHWVLTIFENLSGQQLPFFLEVMSWLAARNFPVPAPNPLRDGRLFGPFKGKPAILAPRFYGCSLHHPAVAHCEAMGRFLARMHQTLATCPQRREAPRNLAWMRAVEARLAALLSPSEARLVSRAIDHYQQLQTRIMACPSGLIHADLFKDNVLFDGEKISGVIDFFHACDDVLLFDLAVVANAWVASDDGRHDPSQLAALIAGYQSVRPWHEEERLLWPHILHLAALKFWLSRLESRHLPGYQQVSTQGDKTKDPDELKRIILQLGFVG